MLIELRSSPTDPNNTPSQLFQRFKETMILKANTKISLVSALITTDTNWYADLKSGGNWNGLSEEVVVFDDTGINDFFRYWTDSVNNPPTTPDAWYYPVELGDLWNKYSTEPTAANIADGTNVPEKMAIDSNTGVITFNKGTPLIPTVLPLRIYLRNTATNIVTKGSETILVNVTNFPINSRNSSGNTDNHIATIPALTNVNVSGLPTNFYEPFNANFHRLDNEGDLNLNHMEVSLTNVDGTIRTDIIHPTQLTFLLTPDYK